MFKKLFVIFLISGGMSISCAVDSVVSENNKNVIISQNSQTSESVKNQTSSVMSSVLKTINDNPKKSAAAAFCALFIMSENFRAVILGTVVISGVLLLAAESLRRGSYCSCR